MATTGGADHQRAAAVARAALRQSAASGVQLPPDLRLWTLAGIGPDGDAGGRAGQGSGSTAGGLAAVLEAATPADVRRANGLHVTPGWLADELVALALEDFEDLDVLGGPICDPACGGGAFLLSAAQALHAREVPRPEAVRRVWGADVDPVGLAAAEVALALWAGEAPPAGHLVMGDPLADGPGIWPERPEPGFAAVVGNPPFLNQLGRATVRSPVETGRLRQRFGEAVQPYTDTAWLFLLLGCELVRDGGRVVLVQPMSLVAARDAAVVRAALSRQADLRHLWVERGRSFAAGVKVCAPVLQVGGPTRSTVPASPAGPRPRRAESSDEASAPGRRPEDDVTSPTSSRRTRAERGHQMWADRLADAIGVPRVGIETGNGTAAEAVRRLGDRATVLAGFRDEYYGLVPLVREADAGPAGAPDVLPPGADPPSDPAMNDGRASGSAQASRRAGPPASELSVNGHRPLVTAGVIDWGRCAWGQRTSRFAKQVWTAPVVDLALVDGDGDGDDEIVRAAARWAVRTGVPKIVVATQTRVVEAAVDETGSWVPSVPTLAVLPERLDDLWSLAAAVASPTATAWLLRRAPETGLSRGALKIAARDLAALPLPTDDGAWAAATTALQAYAHDPTPAGIDAYAQAAADAYGAPPSLVDWWHRRLHRR